jgi:hypothetical protein
VLPGTPGLCCCRAADALWVERYKPTNAHELVGNNTNVATLRQWLYQWEDVQLRGATPQQPKTGYSVSCCVCGVWCVCVCVCVCECVSWLLPRRTRLRQAVQNSVLCVPPLTHLLPPPPTVAAAGRQAQGHVQEGCAAGWAARHRQDELRTHHREVRARAGAGALGAQATAGGGLGCASCAVCVGARRRVCSWRRRAAGSWASVWWRSTRATRAASRTPRRPQASRVRRSAALCVVGLQAQPESACAQGSHAGCAAEHRLHAAHTCRQAVQHCA